MCKTSGFISSLLLLFSTVAGAQSTSDTVAADKPAIRANKTQLRLGWDLANTARGFLVDGVRSYELCADYYFKNELYWAAEAGWGNSAINYPVLNYRSDNFFLRAGFDKALFNRKRPEDWSMAFIGLRYGVAVTRRGDAQYFTDDGLGNKTNGVIPAKYFSLHWLEIGGGIKQELFKGVFAGWTVRSRFALNQKSIGDLKPAFISGYGPAERGLNFDFNFYLSYAFRWSKGSK
jgi:hypothetical protein